MYVLFTQEEIVALKHFLEDYVNLQIEGAAIDCDGLQSIMNLRQKLIDELKKL